MTAVSKRHLGYIPALDGVRAVAVFLVMLGHVGVPGFAGGGLGVDMFFVLSGFLITTLLLEEIDDRGRIQVLHFYARRLLRLYPALLLMLLLFAVMFHILRHTLPDAGGLECGKDVTLAALYLTDYAVAFGFQSRNSLIAHVWSLAVEEHFYLIWPWALMGLKKALRGRYLVIALFALYVAATGWRLLCLSFQPWELVYFRFDTRLAGLVLGAALAALRRQGYPVPAANIGLALSAAIFAILVYRMPTMGANTYLTTVPEIFTFFLIDRLLALKDWMVRDWLAHPAAVFLGRISYGLYLFHFPVAILLTRTPPGSNGTIAPATDNEHWAVQFEITVAIALALAWFSWNTVEKAGRAKMKAFRPKAQQKHIPAAKTASGA